MTGRKLLIALVATALYAVVLVSTASAELRQVRVTLVDGQTLTLTVDVPPNTSVQDLEIPGLPAEIKTIEDLGPVATATPSPTATSTPQAPTPTPTVTITPTPTATPGNQQGGGSNRRGGHGNSRSGGGDGSTRARPPANEGGNEAQGNVEESTGRAEDKPRRGGGNKDSAPDTGEDQADDDGQTAAPTPANPTYSVAEPGPARIGVPNFFIDKFRIPPFLLPIYQAAGVQYGIRWEVLAAINEIETDYGRNLNVSSAGALGWMQFMPATWEAYGVDANGDKIKDPYNPVDAIFAAARYLRAAGADKDLNAAIFAYNHADWYVDSVLLRAQVIGGLPGDLVGSLTGLTQGRFPIAAKATYAGQVTRPRRVKEGNAATVVESEQRQGIRVFAKAGAPAVAVNDGKIVAVGRSERLGRYVKLQDVYGNTYTYGHLDKVAQRYPAPKPETVTRAQVERELQLPKRDARPSRAASSTDEPARERDRTDRTREKEQPAEPAALPAKERLFAHPTRPNAAAAGGAQQEFERTGLIDGEDYDAYLRRILGLDREEVQLKELKRGAAVVAGTVLGRIGKVDRGDPHLLFEVRPAGRGAPRIDPKPILDGWKLLESTAIYRAAGKNPFFGADAQSPSIGQILLMSKQALTERVLANPNIDIYDCGRRDVQTGQVDRRVLATLEFLAASGLRPTVTSLKCGHGYYTASGNVSHHSSGNAVDIAAINGVTITPETQGAGSITELTIQRLLTLQGTMKPDQIISLMEFSGTDNTFAMGDHHDHIHVGWRPLYGTNPKLTRQVNAILKPDQWIDLIDRLGRIDNPTVREQPSRYAIKTNRASRAHKGE